jgi:hypothetical protein
MFTRTHVDGRYKCIFLSYCVANEETYFKLFLKDGTNLQISTEKYMVNMIHTVRLQSLNHIYLTILRETVQMKLSTLDYCTKEVEQLLPIGSTQSCVRAH